MSNPGSTGAGTAAGHDFAADVEGYGRLMHRGEEATKTLSSRRARSVGAAGYVGRIAIRRNLIATNSQNWTVCFAGEALAFFSIFTQGGCCPSLIARAFWAALAQQQVEGSAVPCSVRLRLEN